MVHKILLPVEGSAESMAAARLGIEFAKSQGAVVHGLVVIDPYLYAGVGQASNLGQQAHTLEVAPWAEQHLSLLRTQCEALKLVFHSSTVEHPSVVKGILEAQQSLGCDRIALGSRGRGLVSSWVLGSVAQKVLAQSQAPVMVIRA